MQMGWIKLHRVLLESRYGKDCELMGFWIYLLLQAHHGDKPIFDGFGNKIGAGQFSTGRKKISRETRLSESKTERFLEKLEIEQQIGQQKTSRCRIITIINWQRYQIPNSESDNHRTTTGQPSDNHRTHNKKYNNVNNVKKGAIDRIKISRAVQSGAQSIPDYQNMGGSLSNIEILFIKDCGGLKQMSQLNEFAFSALFK